MLELGRLLSFVQRSKGGVSYDDDVVIVVFTHTSHMASHHTSQRVSVSYVAATRQDILYFLVVQVRHQVTRETRFHGRVNYLILR